MKSASKNRNGGTDAGLSRASRGASSEHKELSTLLRSISHPKIDRNLIRKNVRLCARLRNILGAASPQSTVNLIGGIAVDLADFWGIGEEHKLRVKELLEMRFPKDRKRFEDMLYEFEIGLVMHAEWHAKHLRRRLEKMKKDLKLK
jgi:hypothetical protein